MHEKKMSTGVIRVRMNACTIVALILVPFLLFILYAILFSQCSELLKNSGYITSCNKSGNDDLRKDGTFEKASDVERSDDGIDELITYGNFDDENAVTGPLSSDTDTEMKPSIVFRIINLLFFIPSKESDDESGKDEIKHIFGDESQDEDNILLEDIVSHPVKDIKKQDASTQTDENVLTGKESKKADEAEKRKDEKKEEQREDKTLGDAQSTGEQKETNAGKTKNYDESLSKNTEIKVVNEAQKNEMDEVEIYDSMFGPLVTYNYDSWDFSIPNSLVCPKDGEDLYLLIIIHSEVKNFEARQAIRETWGRIANMDGINYAFILGIAADNHLDNKLKHESDSNQDIIMTDLSDYDNETAKSVMSLKWIMYYCPKVKYVFKTNDDVFVNIPQLAMYLNEESTKDDRMYGYLYEGYKPERNPKKEGYVTKKEFAPDVYPNYLAPEGYIFPGKFAPILFKTALKMTYMPIENIFITGILAEKLNIPRKDEPLFSSTFPDLPKTEKCNILSYTVVFHPLTPQGLRYFWDDLRKTSFKCGDFLKNVGKMIQKDKRMYSDTNEKLLYALLTGENAEKTGKVDKKEEIVLPGANENKSGEKEINDGKLSKSVEVSNNSENLEKKPDPNDGKSSRPGEVSENSKNLEKKPDPKEGKTDNLPDESEGKPSEAKKN